MEENNRRMRKNEEMFVSCPRGWESGYASAFVILGLWMREVKIQLNTEIAKKHRFLAAAILLLIGKVIITW